MIPLNSLAAMLGSTMLRGWPVRIPGADSLLGGLQPMLKHCTASSKPVHACVLIQHIPLLNAFS